MRIGPLHVTWRTSQRQRDDRAALAAYLRDDPAPREQVARMARSEVKNLLAEIAEEAGVPYGGPAQLLRELRAD